MDLKIYIETYGCQMNVADSQVASAILKASGCSFTEDITQADVILVNTCSVRDNAEKRVLGRLDVFRLEKKKRNVTVGVLGCMAQRLKERLLENPAVDFTIGPDSYRSLPAVISFIRDHGGKMTETNLSIQETYADIEPVRTDSNGVSAFISIMRGCNNLCSYCIVPFTRGRERSRDPKSIVAEAEQLAKEGYKEITLLGQNVDSYNWTDPENTTRKVNFSQLLELVAIACPKMRIRFQTSHPKDIRKGVLYTMAMYPNICPHIHLPVQSGSTRLLQKMNRKYTREDYLQKISDIRNIMPDCAITTDIIAGFCSETEEDHKQTLSLMQEVQYDSAFMFQYSQRPDTLAAKRYPDDVPEEEKTRRLNEIIALQNTLSLKSNQKCIGQTYQVLVEGPSKRSEDQMTGRTPQNRFCVFDAKDAKPGDFVWVKILTCTQATLMGEIVEQPKSLIEKAEETIEEGLNEIKEKIKKRIIRSKKPNNK
ncbi:MAG: tRNA (N6-isopentenyl adenosine(37)-C2)-methylthiotransferase MiaB [Bacteroidales bacterium]|jgi:tRNA-2-methylthio-N6-dimethylallyladenosine synthase|nr:tRNA (N6-isopentenyl adenosine(37)-C2)-methylthiotransferase MiaB [Bacteroidales bacterium]MBR6971495.1 tRNA (N6-isopentenyl adenosine(37)-C2)-methylthiotransferase MiaB [Bacteroidales bacterium]